MKKTQINNKKQIISEYKNKLKKNKMKQGIVLFSNSYHLYYKGFPSEYTECMDEAQVFESMDDIPESMHMRTDVDLVFITKKNSYQYYRSILIEKAKNWFLDKNMKRFTWMNIGKKSFLTIGGLMLIVIIFVNSQSVYYQYGLTMFLISMALSIILNTLEEYTYNFYSKRFNANEDKIINEFLNHE